MYEKVIFVALVAATAVLGAPAMEGETSIDISTNPPSGLTEKDRLLLDNLHNYFSQNKLEVINENTIEEGSSGSSSSPSEATIRDALRQLFHDVHNVNEAVHDKHKAQVLNMANRFEKVRLNFHERFHNIINRIVSIGEKYKTTSTTPAA